MRAVYDEEDNLAVEDICIVDEARVYHQFGTHMPGRNRIMRIIVLADAIIGLLLRAMRVTPLPH